MGFRISNFLLDTSPWLSGKYLSISLQACSSRFIRSVTQAKNLELPLTSLSLTSIANLAAFWWLTFHSFSPPPPPYPGLGYHLCLLSGPPCPYLSSLQHQLISTPYGKLTNGCSWPVE